MSKTTKLYQICVKGYLRDLDDYFRAHSKQVYKRKPTENEIDNFVEKCTDETINSLYVLDAESDYEVTILELELVE